MRTRLLASQFVLVILIFTSIGIGAEEHALFDDHPKMRYMVVPNQGQAEITIGKALEEIVQLNQDHLFSYDRDTLVKMLDETLVSVQTQGSEK